MIGRHKKDILITGIQKKSVQKRAKDIHGITDTLGQHGMFVFEKSKQRNVEGIPIVEKSEFYDVVSSKELIKLLKELEEDE